MSTNTLCQRAVDGADTSPPCQHAVAAPQHDRALLTDLPLLWLQVLTVTGNHILYKAPGDASLHPVVTTTATSNATFAASFAARVPVPAMHVKVLLASTCLLKAVAPRLGVNVSGLSFACVDRLVRRPGTCSINGDVIWLMILPSAADGRQQSQCSAKPL